MLNSSAKMGRLFSFSFGFIIVFIFNVTSSSASGDLLLHYKFNESSGLTASSAVNTSTDSDLTLTAANWSTGVTGTAAWLSSNSQAAVVSDLETWQQSGSFTAMLWVNITGGGNSMPTLMGVRDGNTYYSNYQIRMEASTKRPVFFMRDQDFDKFQITAPDPITLNEWTHLAATFDSATGGGKLYVDGILAADSTTWSGGGNNGFSGFDLSRLTTAGIGHAGYSMNGSYDEVRIYNHVLSQSEIQLIINNNEQASYSPEPENGATDVPVNKTLEWSCTDGTTGCDVYFGDDPVIENNPKVIEVSDGLINSYDPPFALDLNTNYYWRVDVSDGTELYPGVPWSFKTQESLPVYMLLEDFYVYTSTSELLGAWDDGSSNGTGSTVSLAVVDLGVPLGFENHIAEMRLEYDNAASPWKSETGTVFLSPMDWLSTGLDTLSLSVRGVLPNSPADLYLTVEDGTHSATVFHSDPDTATRPWWTEWNIRIKDFADLGVDLTHITKLAIGVGNGAASGDTGEISIDDLHLCSPGYLPEFGLAGDLNCDRAVDIYDMVRLANSWLLKDFVVTASAPDNTELRAKYSFDETSGSVASDSSGNNFDATVTADDVNGVWDGSGRVHGCIKLDPSANVSLPSAVFAGISEAVSIGMWVYGDGAEYPGTVDHLFFTAGDPVKHQNTWDTAWWGLGSAEAYGDQWNHFAVVKDASAGVVRIYHNGLLMTGKSDLFETMDGSLAEVSNIALIDNGGADKHVRIDEICIYSYALSQDEIVHLFAGSSGSVIQPIQPLYTTADVVPDGSIDFYDFAAFSAEWFLQQ